MDRTSKFESMATHPWLKRVFAKLSKADIEQARTFCQQNANLDRNAFECEVNRLFVDKPKPRHWKEICELLANANV